MTGNAEQVFDMYGDMILRLAIARTGSRQDGEDLLQEVFVRYIRSGIVFESEEHRKAWLIKVTINCSKSLLKSGWKTRQTSLEECHGICDEVNTASEVYEAVMSLPAKYRTVIHLFYYEELSTGQIAKSMECSEGTVRSLLSRGRKKLQKILKGEELHV